MDREKLLDRIRRLLRLAESPNVHEAAAAAARAQELMERHRIEAAALDDADAEGGIEDHRDAPLDESKRLRPWKVELADAIARANGCRIYLLARGGMDAIVLVGKREDAELVRALHPELVKQVECLTRKHGAGQDRAYCNGLRLGIVTTLGDRLALAAAESRRRALAGGDPTAQGTTPGDAALAVRRLEARDDAVERFMRERMRLSKGRGKSFRADADGYARGRMVGQTVSLGAAEKRR